MGVFGGIEKAEVFGGGANIRPGMHLLEVRELLVHKSRKKAGVVYFVVEATVLESTGGRPITAKAVDNVGSSLSHPKGERVSWLSDLSQPSGLGNVKGFAMALAPGTTESDVTEESMNGLVASEQPAAGIKVWCDAYMELTQKSNDFTKCRFSPYVAP